MISTSRSFAGLPSSRKRNFAVFARVQIVGMRQRHELESGAHAPFTAVGVADADEGFHASLHLLDFELRGVGGNARRPFPPACRASASACRLLPSAPSPCPPATPTRYVPGWRSSRSKLDRVGPWRGFCAVDGRAIRPATSERIDGHRALVEREQVVGHRGIERRPSRRSSRGWSATAATTRAPPSCARAGREQAASDGEFSALNISWVLPDHGFSVSATAPSSVLPWRAVAFAPLIGHSNGMRTASRPPTSRTASTTSAYLPGRQVSTAASASRRTSAGAGPRVASRR